MTTADELFGALSRLRDAARGERPRDLARERADWRVVDAFVRRSRSSQGEEGEDVAQETLIAIAKHVGDLDARDGASAVSWATRIVRHKKIDLVRARVRQGERVEPREGEASVLDLLEGDAGRPIEERAVAMLVELVEEAIVARVEKLGLTSAADRQLKRTQARATLHRVLGADKGELRALLAIDRSIGDDRLAKWVERGRPFLAAVIEGLAWDHEGDAREVLLALRDGVLARRADAGMARPTRRKRKEGEAS